MPQIFLDGADVEVIVPELRLGGIAGVTTNPEILAGAGITRESLGEFVLKILAAGAQAIFVQSWGLCADEMYRNAVGLQEIDPRIVVKIPWTDEGSRAGRRLVVYGASVLATAVFTVEQVISAQACGVHWIAPYVDSIERTGTPALGVLSRMSRVTGSATILAADVHTPARLADVLDSGIDAVTVEPEVWFGLNGDPNALAAAERFEGFVRP